MKRFLLAAVLAVVAASQADAQMLRRYRPAYYSNSSYSPYVYGSSNGVVTAGYSTPTYSYYPDTYYSYPNYSYPTWSGYSNYSTWNGYNYPTWSGYSGNVNYRGWRRGYRW